LSAASSAEAVEKAEASGDGVCGFPPPRSSASINMLPRIKPSPRWQLSASVVTAARNADGLGMTLVSEQTTVRREVERGLVLGGFMASAEESACSRAKAYLKVKEFGHLDNGVSLAHRDAPIIKDLTNSLCVAYVVDEGGHFKYLQNRDCEKSGLSKSEIHKISVRNLAELAKERIQIRPYGNIYAVMLDGNFEASLILVDGLWEKV
jgi:hypothetical protein